MSPLETLQLWFATFAEDPGAARDLWAEGATLHAVDGGFTGDFDDLLAWYARRRDNEGAGFAWYVLDHLGGERYAAAVIRMVSDARPGGWQQNAVYEISEGKIGQVWLHESESAE
ncbi:nuclear transport factor 2 family protein [Nocardioides immobilis]|nr:nuclear transport factor 2 family protein [Nocardioides immobilis]